MTKPISLSIVLLLAACTDGQAIERLGELETRVAALEKQLESRSSTSETEAKIREELASLQRGRTETAEAIAKLEETLATVQRRQEELGEVAGREPEATPAAAGVGEIGIPECDRFIAAYTACIDNKFPEAARAPTREAMEQTLDAWKLAAAGPGAAALAATCKEMAEVTANATAAFGCEF